MDERTHLLPARGLVIALISLAFLAGCRGVSLVPSGSLSQSSSATNPADMGETIPKHVITADYFGSIYSNPRLRGSKKVPPSEAAKYLDWGDVVPADQQTTADAGMKTLFYYRPTFQGRGDPFYKSDQFAHSCSGHRIAIYKRDGGGHPMYLMSRSPKQAGLAADYIKQVLQQNAFDVVFEDDAGFAPYQLGIHPCNLQASEWIDRDARLEKEVHAKQLPSSLNAFTEDAQHVWTQNQQSLDLALHHEGGLMEQCYSSNSNPQVYFISDTLWVAQENTEIAVVGGNKLFFCYVRNYSPAKAQIAERIYDYASFLLSYRPQFAVLWETYLTPSNFHVLPESGFVALHPLKAQPTDITQLKSGGVYVREYSDCYYRGKLLGPCAAIVNPSSSTATSNPLYGKYRHTLVLSGGGVTDGGTVKFTGPTAPKSVQRDRAYVAL